MTHLSLLVGRLLVVTVLLGLVQVASSESVHRATCGLDLATKEAIESDWLRQEQVTRKQDAGSKAAVDGVLKRGNALVSEMRKLGAVRPAANAAKRLAVVKAKRNALAKKDAGTPKEWKELHLEARWAVRELAFANPVLNSDRLLFVRRYWPSARVHYFHHLGVSQEPGADLCVLTGLSPDGKLKSLISGKLSPGGIGRPSLSFDAKTVLFPYAAPAAYPAPFHSIGGLFGGPCDKFAIYEIGVDGGGLRKLFDAPNSENTEPSYLPDGRIAFTSSRDGYFVQCLDLAPVFGMYSTASDGTDIRRMTVAKEVEWYPSLLEDGRILYTRWEYVMKPYESIQNLWTVYPDGTHAQLAYGDHYAFSEGPRTFFEARQIPGTSNVLCIGAGHHNTGVGPLLMVDLNKNRGGKDGFVNLTPEVPFPETGYNEDILSDGGWYASPYPLSEDFYIVCYSFERDEANQSGYGLYLLDRFGNKELIYRDAAMSCYAPIPIAPRKRPPVIPDSTVGRDPNMPGKMVLANVYEGLPGVKNGTVKYLRVLESLRKPMHTTPFNVDTGKECGLDPRVVLGTVPVEPDGSAYFTIPQDRPVFFEALDKNFLEIRRMRSFVSTRPGETISCLGCHEPYSRVASRKMPTATSRPPSEIAPPPWGKGVGMDFRQLVQPLLNRRCISCHDGSTGSARSFDLRGDTLDEVRAGNGNHYANPMQSYTNLLQYVNYIHLRAYDDGVYNEGNLPLKPYAIGSGVSKLMQLLKNSHRGVTLSEHEWQLLAAWIDCNAPFYGEWDDICFRGERTVRERKAELEKQSPGGYGLAAYVNGGVRQLDQVAGGPAMLIEGGSRYAYYVGDETAASHYAVVLHSPKVLNVQLGSMDPNRAYKLGLSWWDYEGIGAVQSVTAVSSDGKVTRTLISERTLPTWAGKNQMPEELVVDLPSELSRTGDVWIKVNATRGRDVLLSEVWLYEDALSLKEINVEAGRPVH